METHSTLRDLIEILEREHKFRICIHFFNKALIKKLQLTRNNVVHDNGFCNAMKKMDSTHARCILCRHKAIEKACREKRPFAGYCTFGVFESCYPVFQGDVPLCVVCVGNIRNDRKTLLERSGLPEDHPLLDGLEQGMDEELCFKISAVIASNILMRCENMEDAQGQSIHATVAAIRDYVDHCFYQELSLESLAQHYHYNEKYLGNLFKKNMGISFREYLNNCRLDYARNRLLDTSTSILDIAKQAGFCNVTYFNRLFKAKFDLTPSQYREKKKAEKKHS